jgi:hypothetical protein
MTVLPTIANGDTADATAQYNLLVAALAAIGITDDAQTHAIFEELRLKDANTFFERSGADLQLTDAVTGTKTLSELAGGYATPLTYGSSGIQYGAHHFALTPLRVMRTCVVEGFRVYCAHLGGGHGTFQMALYSDDRPLALLAPTPVTTPVVATEMSVLLPTPYALLPDRLYWVGYCPIGVDAWQMFSVLCEGAFFSRAYTPYGLSYFTGLPQTIDWADTHPNWLYVVGAYYNFCAPAFQLIIDGGMEFE